MSSGGVGGCAGDEELKEMGERKSKKVCARHRPWLSVEPVPGNMNLGSCGES